MTNVVHTMPTLPKAANEESLTPEERADAEVARRVFERLYADSSVRELCLRFLADCIIAANEVNPEAWSITLFGDALTLNAGWIKALYLRRNRLFVIFDPDRLAQDHRERLQALGTFGVMETDTPRQGIEIEAIHLHEAIPVLRESAIAQIRHEASLNQYSRFIGTHSPGVIDYLRVAISPDVPHSSHRKLPRNEPRTKRYWKISAGPGGSAWKHFRDRSLIALYWDGSPDFDTLGASSRDDLAKQLADAEWLQGSDIRYNATQIWHILKDMQPGDQVVAYGSKTVLGIGTITGEYRYEVDDFNFPHRRTVEWFTTDAQSIQPLTPALQTKLQRNATIVPLTREEFEEIRTGGIVGIVPLRTNVVADSLNRGGFRYTDWQIATFYTALQTKGIVILSGISGTGKTKLVQHFAALLPQPKPVPQPSETQAPITVHPYMLKYGRFIVPRRIFQYAALPPAAETQEVDLYFAGQKQKCRLYQYPEEKNVSALLLRGAARKWFNTRFVEGDQFILEPVLDDEQQLAGFRVTPVTEWEADQAVGEQADEDNLLFLSVRPDWRDSKSLLGYYNPLTQTYEQTEFVRFVMRASKSFREGDGLAWFVVLDEMNLAHVEYYFADLLSVLESGRNAAGWTREPLRLNYPETVEGDVPPREIALPPNLYIVGTVNIDETTHAFSPKVLDRAFSIELVDVDFSGYPPNTGGVEVALSTTERQNLLADFTRDGRFPRIDKTELAAYVEHHPDVRVKLQKLNELLQPYTMHFGYRVFDEIVMFLAVADENRMFDGIPSGGDDPAFDAAVLMKVLPKFHGSRSKLEEPLKAVLAWCLDPHSPNLDQIDTLMHSSDGNPMMALSQQMYALPRTADRVRRMLQDLRRDGFTAFG